jgi:hypothetical protein
MKNIDLKDTKKSGEKPEGFIPNREELVQLIRYWITEDLESEWFFINTGCADTYGSKIYHRLSQLKALAGEDVYAEAAHEAIAKFREAQFGNMKPWQPFTEQGAE